MAQSCEDVLPTLRDFFNSKKPGEEDEFMFCPVLNSSSNSIPPRPTKLGSKTKERHSFFFNQGSKERSRRNISDAERFSVEQYSSGGFFGVRLNTNTRQKQRSAKPLGSSQRNMEPRLQKSFSARMHLPFMPTSKGSNQSSSTNSSSSTSWFNRIKKLSNPFSNRNPLIPPKSGCGEMLSRDMSLRTKSSSPVHLHAYLNVEYELGMPVFTFSLDHPDDVYMANTWMDDHDSRFVYSFRYVGGRSNKNIGEQRFNASGIESSVIGQMQVSAQICLEPEPPYDDLVESNVSEFILFDIARGLKHENLSRQTSFRRDPSQSVYSEIENRVSLGSNDSNLRQENISRQNSFSRGLTRNLSKHSEHNASDPWRVSDLHPGLEIAAIVIRDSSSSNEYFGGDMKNSKLLRREMKVIVPTGNHGLPDTENSCPTPILQRWRSGGGCDCSGWDMGCQLFVLESPNTHFSEETELTNNHHHLLELFIEGGKENTPAMTMALNRVGHYEVNFHAKLSALQAFSVCVAELHKTVISRGERSNSLSRCSSLRELIDMETPVNGDTREVLSSFMPNVTFSPISRV